MKRTIGATVLAIGLVIVVRGTRFADAQPPVPPPSTEPLPVPPLPGQPGLMVPIKVNPETPANPPAKPSEPAAPKATQSKPDNVVTANIEVAKETSEPPLAESTATTPVSGNSLITGTIPVPVEM